MGPIARPDLRRIAGIAGLACLPVLVWLSWIPKDWELRTGAAGQVEHLLAYAGTAGLLGLGFHRVPAWRLGLALAALAGILEIGQIWVPGRTAQVIDFAASAGGALLGLAAARAFAGHLMAARSAARSDA
ncbi:hypothetical protein VQ03_19815 [Methylobacterium tarhaniae]|uniref:VanZ-like domain-containing protein n=1 Tax=Methylobacterium tarhaniae TaxID=1187852 RepID=A0A0J6SPC2_9HYPH|nr:hypothetical protein [Methylobacterium tarhaniae]KMO37065.1 hypothetical protein VQ03_19815 [Methylobacterium tarhaniae]